MKKEIRRILETVLKPRFSEKTNAVILILAAGFLLFGISCYKPAEKTVVTSETKPSPTNTGPRVINYETKTPGNTETNQNSNNGSNIVRTLKLASQMMGREMPYRVVVPNDYETKTESRYTVVYLLHGLTGHYNDWTDLGNISQLATKHNLILVTPEGNDGWYTDNPSKANEMYESYIVKELIPEIDKSFRTFPERSRRVIAGLSMGGYGAVKFGLKFPDKFSLIGSFSGAFVTAQWSEKVGGNKLIGKSLDAVFGPLNSETRKANDIFTIVRGLSEDKAKNLPFIYLSCGTEDIFIKTNRDLAALMNEKKIPNEFRAPSGGHDWKFWSNQVRDFLDVVERRIAK